jgi:hypothetical protein
VRATAANLFCMPRVAIRPIGLSVESRFRALRLALAIVSCRVNLSQSIHNKMIRPAFQLTTTYIPILT